jgi:TctA family transporter
VYASGDGIGEGIDASVASAASKAAAGFGQFSLDGVDSLESRAIAATGPGSRFLMLTLGCRGHSIGAAPSRPMLSERIGAVATR